MPRTVFLDSKDLINVVRRADPLGLEAAREWFVKYDLLLVLSHTSISELVPADERDRLRIRSELQQLERFPLTYIRLGDLTCAEFFFAEKARVDGEEWPRFVPFVDKFWKTFWELVPTDGADIVFRRELERRIAYRLDEQVFDLWTEPNNFRNMRTHTEALQRKMNSFRLDARRRKERRLSELREWVGGCPLQNVKVELLAEWLAQDPRRAPAWQLVYEVLEEWRANVADAAKDGDVHDITHVGAVPYVDFATLDGRFVAYVKQASRKLARRHAGIDYRNRVYVSFCDLIAGVEEIAAG